MRWLPVILLFCTLGMSAQSTCKVMQYVGNDTLSGTEVCTRTYNERGQLVHEEFKGWQDAEREMKPDGAYTYAYNDTLMTGWKYHSSAGDSSRTEFQYDANGRLIRQSYFEYKMLQGGGTRRVMTPDGWREEPVRRWEQTSLINYSYDDKGRKILYDATRLHYTAQNMYRWEYDEQGRVTTHISYSRGKITWKEDYQYFDWGYRYWRTWYDSEGNLRHEYGPETPQYYPLLFYNCTLDKKGRVTEEKVTDEKQKLHSRTVTVYDAKGRVLKTIYYNAANQRTITHVYIYS